MINEMSYKPCGYSKVDFSFYFLSFSFQQHRFYLPYLIKNNNNNKKKNSICLINRIRESKLNK